jgi:hypothetical protein
MSVFVDRRTSTSNAPASPCPVFSTVTSTHIGAPGATFSGLKYT